MRQRDVADASGLAPATVSLIEGERRRITLDDAVALCRGLNVTLADLLDGADAADLATLGL